MSNIFTRLIKFLNNEYLILFIALFAMFIVRLYKVDNPIADWHSFRQADTASVTRFYLENGIDILHPKYHDISTTQSGLFNPQGYRFVEFPVFNILHLYIFKAFPFLGLETAGRVVSIISSVLSAYLIFLIVKKLNNSKTALISAILFGLLPYNIYFTRVILPEPLAVTFGLAAVWFFVFYLEKNRLGYIMLSALSFSAALLIKPYLFFYALPLLYLFFTKYTFIKGLRIKSLYFWGLVSVIPFILWRLWMANYPEGIPFWKWTFNGDGIRFKPAFWKWIFGERLTALILGYWGLVPFSFGILAGKKKSLFAYVFLIGFFLYTGIFATANVRHDYYQIIGIPALVIILALGIIELWKNDYLSRRLTRSVLFFSIFIMFLASFVQIKEFYKINRPEIVQAGKRADILLPKNALIIAPYNGDTAFLYQTNRKGWPVVDRPIDEMIGNGAEYFVSVDLSHFQTVEFAKRFKVIESTVNYIIIDLTSKNL